MKAMILKAIGSMRENPEPLQLVEIPRPEPGPREILIRVSACGVCHTEINEIEGRTPPPRLPVVLGHEVVGVIAAAGSRVTRHRQDDRVGVGWIYHSSGTADENLSQEFRATGRDANGGYAEYMTVHENYAYSIPDCFTDVIAAPLLCAGGVGYRALRLTEIQNGQVLGLTGFGASGHLVLQLAKHRFPDNPIFVFARNSKERDFAMELGATWSGDTEAEPPELVNAIIDTTPAWRPVLAAMRNLRPGGRLVINAIRKEDADKPLMADIDYAAHLWQEKELKTVANVTRNDIEEFLGIAAEIDLQPEVQTYPLEQANDALRDLRSGHVRGAKVLEINESID
jgi:propanol-preferring alcohol dehydrogenase